MYVWEIKNVISFEIQLKKHYSTELFIMLIVAYNPLQTDKYDSIPKYQ